MGAIYVAHQDGYKFTADAWRFVQALIERVEQHWRQPDDGIWEFRTGPRHFVHSKAMAWFAVDCGVRMAESFKLEAPLERWRKTAAEIHADICEQGYDRHRNTFVQSYGAVEVDASLLLLPIVGFLPPEDPRVRGTLAAIEEDLMFNGLVMRYRTERSADGFPPGEGAFLACSYWLVDNLVLQGRVGEAQALFDRLAGYANDVGLMSEQYDVRAKRMVGNFPQAFSHIALINSALNLARASGHAAARTGVKDTRKTRREAAPVDKLST
jgi:GH15 family glucan-1,4-alpha-glucosidase